jgi:hypothetical protein
MQVAWNANPAPLRGAVEKGVAIMQKTTSSFFVTGGCSSCHAHNLASMMTASARGAGVKAVDEAAAKMHAQQTNAFWSPQEHTLMLRMDAPGGHDMTSFGLLEYAAEQAKPNRTTDAMVHNIAAQQQLAGNWIVDGLARPPMEDGDFAATAKAIRSLAVFGAPGRKAEFTERIARAAAWLRRSTPVNSEERDMQVLGLLWAGESPASVDPMVRAIAALQRADGGWSQTPWLASDAYATGETLAALKEAGLAANDPVYRKGVDFLLKTQLSDGSWHVASRAPKFQPYFQSGFPHGHDQWISMSATAWATMALTYALPDAKALARN